MPWGTVALVSLRRRGRHMSRIRDVLGRCRAGAVRQGGRQRRRGEVYAHASDKLWDVQQTHEVHPIVW